MPAIAHDPHVGDQHTPGSVPGGLELHSDASVVGLDISEVSVVLVEGQPVVVPLPRSVAVDAGFELLDVADDVLFALGVRRPVAVDSPVAAAPVPEAQLLQVGDLDSPVDALAPVTDKLARPAMPSSPVEPVLAPGVARRIDDQDNLTEDIFRLEHQSDAGSPARPYAVGAAARHDGIDAEPQVWPDVERRHHDRDASSEADRIETGATDDGPITPAPSRAEPMESSVLSLAEAPLFPAEVPLFPAAEAPLFPADAPLFPAAEAPLFPAEAPLFPAEAPLFPAARPLLVEASHARRTTSSGFVLRLDDLSITAGDIVVVRGGERSGKTLLVRLLAGFDSLDSGTLDVAGTSNALISDEERTIREGASLGYASTAPMLVTDLTVLENVELALLVQEVAAGDAETAARVELQALGIEHLAERRGDSLARSEAVKVGLARALVGEPALIVADDVTLGLADDTVSDLLYRLLVVAFEGSAVVVTTTDPRVWHALVVERGARAASLDNGLLVLDSE